MSSDNHPKLSNKEFGIAMARKVFEENPEMKRLMKQLQNNSQNRRDDFKNAIEYFDLITKNGEIFRNWNPVRLTDRS